MTVLCFVLQRGNVGISSQNSHPSPNNLKWLIQEYQHPHNSYLVYIFGDKEGIDDIKILSMVAFLWLIELNYVTTSHDFVWVLSNWIVVWTTGVQIVLYSMSLPIMKM